MVRLSENNVILHFRQLFHQYLVDMYAKIEAERLRYITLNQQRLRADSYIHLRDALATDGNISANDLGQIVILPSSFINSPRYLAEYTQDAFCYVRNYGRPDLFITFTCNSNWTEIKNELFDHQTPIHRQDIIARVFRQKLSKLIQALKSGKLFGTCRAFMYSVEWQKRGSFLTYIPHLLS